MSGDPGLTASPWVSVELDDGSVAVDGVPVPVEGDPEDRYLAALQQVASGVAEPLGRPVGVTVSGGSGVVSHLAVHPDGTVESIEELVRAASAPVEVPAPRAPAPSVARAGARRRDGASLDPRRRLAAVAGVVALGAGAVVVAPLFNGSSGDTASSSIGTPRLVDTTPTSVEQDAGDAAAAPRLVGTRPLRLRVVLTATVTSPAPRELLLTLPATAHRVRVTVRVSASDGRVVVRRLWLGPRSPRRVALADVASGPARWSVRAGGARPATGRVVVMSLPPAAPPPAPPVPAAPTTPGPGAGGGNGGGSGGGHGGPSADPTPIDPDDL